MKKWLSLLLCLLAFSSALAEGTFFYSNSPVTTCEQTQSTYDKFYQSGALSVNIPGLKEGLVPQGIAYLEEENCLLFAGYRSDKGSSALIAVSLDTNEIVKEVFLQNTDGTVYNGHAGGVCVTEKNIFLSNAHKLLRIPLETYRALPASASCAFAEAIPVPVNSSYCCCNDGILWVGEFQYGSSYTTDRSHRANTADGQFRAWTCGYVLDPDAENELKPAALENGGDAVPDYILSMTERIQGIAFSGNQFYLSQSYGRKNASIIYRYDNVLLREPDKQAEVSGQSVPLWYLDKNALNGALICPPMSECLCAVDGRIYVLFESGAETYMTPDNASLNPMDRVFCLTDF